MVKCKVIGAVLHLAILDVMAEHCEFFSSQGHTDTVDNVNDSLDFISHWTPWDSRRPSWIEKPDAVKANRVDFVGNHIESGNIVDLTIVVDDEVDLELLGIGGVHSVERSSSDNGDDVVANIVGVVSLH